MNKLNLLIIIISFLSFIQPGKSQNLFMEIGGGIGNVVAEKHTLCKA